MKRNVVVLRKKKETKKRKKEKNQIPPRQGGISKVKYPVDFGGNVHTILA